MVLEVLWNIGVSNTEFSTPVEQCQWLDTKYCRETLRIFPQWAGFLEWLARNPSSSISLFIISNDKFWMLKLCVPDSSHWLALFGIKASPTATRVPLGEQQFLRVLRLQRADIIEVLALTCKRKSKISLLIMILFLWGILSQWMVNGVSIFSGYSRRWRVSLNS